MQAGKALAKDIVEVAAKVPKDGGMNSRGEETQFQSHGVKFQFVRLLYLGKSRRRLKETPVNRNFAVCSQIGVSL